MKGEPVLKTEFAGQSKGCICCKDGLLVPMSCNALKQLYYS